MKGITVKALKEMCDDLVKDGYGDREILISQDDEGNGYHTLYASFITDRRTLLTLHDFGLFQDWNDPDNVVILG